MYHDYGDKMKHVKYIGTMDSGIIHTGEGIVNCKRNETVEVSNKQFNEIVPLKGWVGIYPKKKKEVEKNEVNEG